MSLNILPAPTPVRFEDESSRAVSGAVHSRSAWIAFDLYTDPNIGSQSYLLEALSNHLRVYITSSAGPGFRISHSHEADLDSAVTGSTAFSSGAGYLGVRVRCVVEFDEPAGETRYTLKTPDVPALTHVEPIPVDHSIRMSFFTIRLTGSSNGEIQWYSVCENTDGSLTQAEKDSYLADGTVPASATHVQEPSGTGFVDTLVPAVGTVNMTFTNPVVGETDAGSPHAPYLTVSASSSEPGWQSIEIRDALTGAKIPEGTLISAAIYDDANTTVLVAMADYSADSLGRIRIVDAGVGAVGTPIKIRIYIGSDNFTANGEVANV